MEVKESGTTAELEKIIRLRYTILREPWDKPIDTATDELESLSVNAYIEKNGEVIACGRLQENEGGTGQIRYMAVRDDYKGKGLGKQIVNFLEKEAQKMNLKKIELQARENAVEFYKACGYQTKEKSFLLWGLIQHYLMEKNL